MRVFFIRYSLWPLRSSFYHDPLNNNFQSLFPPFKMEQPPATTVFLGNNTGTTLNIQHEYFTRKGSGGEDKKLSIPNNITTF